MNDEILLWDNPMDYGFSNPRRRRRKARRRNPATALALPKGMQNLMMGVGVEDVIGGGAGLLAATALPGMILPAEPVTFAQKATRVGVGVLSAIAAGYVADAVAGKRAAKAAVIGGLGGTAILAVNSLTPIKLGSAPVRGALTAGNYAPVRNLVSRRGVSTQTPGFEDLKLF